MRPWRHAKSSAGKDRDWQLDLPIHEFLDMTKMGCADRRHRVVLHHSDLGAAIAQLAFPDRHADIPSIVEQHIREDMGVTCSLADWFEHIELERLPSVLPRRLLSGKEGVVRMIAQPLPHPVHQAVEEVVDFLYLPSRFVAEPIEKTVSILMNSIGLFLVRRVFGPPVEVRDSCFGQTCVIDHGWIAEAVIFSMFGRIPDLREVVQAVRSEPGEGQRPPNI
ncbi:DUF6915 family protein [Roseibium sp. M-1]